MNSHQNQRLLFENWIKKMHAQFVGNQAYKRFIDGQASREDAIQLVRQVAKAHLRSGPILGFLFSIAPPNSREHIKHNLLEELGLEHEGDPSHPDLLRRLGTAIGIQDWDKLEADAELTIRNKAIEPLMFGTIMETGLNVMLEVFAFEWLLSRESRAMGVAIDSYLKVGDEALSWFYHHSEVDIEHAEQGLDTLVDFVNYYTMDQYTVQTIAEITFRSNIFLKRYFDLQVEAGI